MNRANLLSWSGKTIKRHVRHGRAWRACGLYGVVSGAPELRAEVAPRWFRGDAKHRTRNLEILRCAIAHHSSHFVRPGMTGRYLCRRSAHALPGLAAAEHAAEGAALDAEGIGALHRHR